MENTALAGSLRAAIATRDAQALRESLEDLHPADIALVVATLDGNDIWRVLSALTPQRRAKVFGYLPPGEQVALAHALNRRNLAEIFLHMSSDERADLYNHLSEEQREAVLPGLAQAERDDIRKLAGYEEGTAGAIMTSDYATLRPEWSVREAIQRLRREAPDKETIYQTYVIDNDRKLVGTVSLRELMVATDGARVVDLMKADVISAQVLDPQEEVAVKIAKYDLIALPILDTTDKLVGIVTYDDAMDVAEEEATEDFHRVGTVGPLETSVKEARIPLLYRKRVLWLVLLVFGNLFSSAGIAFFEDTITAYVALVFFLPLLIGSGGNAGSQSATLMVRAIAIGDVQLRDWGRMLGRELAVAGLLGITMAVAASAVGMLRGGPEIAFVVASTMMLVVIVGSVIGMSLPFALSQFNLDPATASAPLVTSIADATGVVIYFTVATLVLQMPPGG